MTTQDLIVTPIWFILFSIGAYLIRPYVTDDNTRKYFMPALWVRFVAAIMLGALYQFYYGGGDTFAFHTHGSAHIFDAFAESPMKGLRMIFGPTDYAGGTFDYARSIWYYRDQHSYFVIRVAAFFDLLTLKTYSATALFFAAFSFSGLWALFQVFYQRFTNVHKLLAISILFIPSVIFWGSGILKDTITLGAIGWLTWFFYQTAFQKDMKIHYILGGILMAYILYVVKIYILLAFLPALLFFLFINSFKKIRSTVLRLLVGPFTAVIVLALAFLLINTISANNPRYSLDNIAKTAQITAYDIRYGWGARDGAGAGYDLGNLDGTWQSMVRLAPAAINVSLFRPYPWEISNPLMALASLEAILVLGLTLYVLLRNGFFNTFKVISDNYILFSIVFALIFAYAVGISTFNFGTLMRYKIPLMPFYLSALVMIYHLKRERKASLFASTEYSASTV